ncbi:MAG: LytR/AlgR family response regulator transcription factor [Bacillota bacterium]
MKLRTLIVDDEYPARQELRLLLGVYADLEIVGEAANGQEALQLIKALDYSVVFLDIDMPGLDGLSVSRMIPELARRPLIIFVTAHEKFALEAFSLEAVDYLLKPISQARLEKTIRKVLQMHNAMNNVPAKVATTHEDRRTLGLIPVEDKGKTFLIEDHKIIYVYASNDYTYIKTQGYRYLTRFTLKELEQRLNPELFFRCHRSYLVNVQKTREVIPLYNGTLILIVDDTEKSEVPVSRTQARVMRQILGL